MRGPVTILAAIIGICISACVFVPLRIRSERESDQRISDLEDRIQDLEMAVAEARRNLQPQDGEHFQWPTN
jgi:archaellum component FlaC